MNQPLRGEIWLVDLGLVGKARPCLVISIPALVQDRALVALVPHTTSARGSRFKVDVKNRVLKSGVFDAQNLITVPHAKLIRRLGLVTAAQLAQVETVVKFWLGLDPAGV